MIFKKKCEYCKRKIEKDGETLRNVKDQVFVGTKEEAFCCSDHADKYEEEVLNAKKVVEADVVVDKKLKGGKN